MSSPQELIGSITDEDIEWVGHLMKLDRLDDARRSFLKALDTVDVSACPGSGKTTLVVAKLAILASKWRSATQGICVLSHTNVAREEIQRRLADTDVGHKLLSYPHYIDTIHGFVNRFLAIPWLLSNGHGIAAVDNDITYAVRRRNLGADCYRLATYFTNRNYDLASLRMGSSDIADPLKGVKRFPVRPHTPTYKKVAAAVQRTAEEGYFCHEEMFHFAAALLAAHPEVANILATRFPFVLVDEMQDTSARQNSVLSPLFDNRAESVSLQRVGDANQAIYDDNSAPDEASAFPDSARRNIPLSSSFRFDQTIAALASGLALDHVGPDGLQGIRVVDENAKRVEHTIFVFPDDDTSLVLPTYAEHVLSTFDDDALIGDRVTAIGCVHRPKAQCR
jgi:superfamily I DNA/RNA helicase